MAATSEARTILDRIMQAKKISQNEVGRQVGISPSYLARLATGDLPLTAQKEYEIKIKYPELFPEVRKDVGIPFFNVDFCLGYDAVFNDYVEQPAEYVKHPLNGHADCWVVTRGNSMAPLISSGDLIAIREVQAESVLFGDVYAIVLDEYRTVKRIRRGSKPTKWRLVPENKTDFDEQEVDISSVIKVYHVDAVAKSI